MTIDEAKTIASMPAPRPTIPAADSHGVASPECPGHWMRDGRVYYHATEEDCRQFKEAFAAAERIIDAMLNPDGLAAPRSCTEYTAEEKIEEAKRRIKHPYET